MNMNIELLTEAEIATLRENIINANRIVICCHKSPDGDAMGASSHGLNICARKVRNPK